MANKTSDTVSFVFFVQKVHWCRYLFFILVVFVYSGLCSEIKYLTLLHITSIASYVWVLIFIIKGFRRAKLEIIS